MDQQILITSAHHATPEWDMPSKGFVERCIVTDQRHELAEMRVHEDVWKHRQDGARHFGFQQYRRWFVTPAIDRFWDTAHHNPTMQVIQCGVPMFVYYARQVADLPQSAWNWVSDYDVVCPRPMMLGTTMGRHYHEAHLAQDWEVFAHIMHKEGLYTELPYLIAFNMFIMSARLFDDYMTLWSRIISAAQGLITPTPGPQQRVFGFLSERLFTAWLYKLRCERPMLRVLNLPVLFCPEMTA